MDETKETQALLALSEAREALVAAPDDASDERMKELRGKVSTAEREYRQAISDRVAAQAKAAEEAEKDAADVAEDGIDAEERERRDLIGRSSLAAYITAAAVGQPVKGAERELSEAYGIPGAIPLQFFKPRVEERAQTDPPATTDVVFHPTIHPLFDASVAPFLMVDMPMVEPGVQQYPVLQTSLTASMQAKGGEAPETAAVYGNLLTANPKRLGGGYRLRREDLAILPRMESDLNRNIRMVLADTLDAQILNGDGTGANLNGILTQLTDAADPGAVVTFDSALGTYVDQIDGAVGPRHPERAGVGRNRYGQETGSAVPQQRHRLRAGRAVSADEHRRSPRIEPHPGSERGQGAEGRSPPGSVSRPDRRCARLERHRSHPRRAIRQPQGRDHRDAVHPGWRSRADAESRLQGNRVQARVALTVGRPTWGGRVCQ